MCAASRQPPSATAPGPTLTLKALAELVGGRVIGERDVVVTGVQQDSRRVAPGDLFVALKGQHCDAMQFAESAVARGACAIMSEPGREAMLSVPRLEVEAPREALAEAAAEVYGRPTEALQVVGITGTNGKTTTAYLLQTCLDAAGARTGLVGTVGYQFEEFQQAASHTSPEADELQRVAREMLRRGASHLVMEVSSIALVAQRVAGVRFAVAAFTNLTQDHLDYHGTMVSYAAAKDRLFTEHGPGACVINVDDAHGAGLAEQLRSIGGERVLRVSADANADAEVKALAISQSSEGIEMSLAMPSGEYLLRAPLIGDHNVSNLLLALAIVEALELEVSPAIKALGEAPQVPGRLERCDVPGEDDIVALVDYAHTPDALSRALAGVRALTGGRLWCVFGCGGDRDKDKRAPMGEAVGRGADVAIVTNDNPRSEEPEVIAAAIVDGLVAAAGAEHQVILDRARAIALAVSEADSGDVILIAGKGHESHQVLADETIDFDDTVVLRAALARRREGGR